MPTISKFLIKRSSGNTAPTDLKSGEIAYTWGNDKKFKTTTSIETDTGTIVFNGGVF